MTEERAGYRRSVKSPRGEARRRELLDKVADELGTNGLVDFSLRRAARAAGTTHKVLLYHFEGAEDLLTQAVLQLRERRITRALAAATEGPDNRSLADRVRSMWPTLIGEESWVLDQAIGLAMYDAGRYADLARTASRQYLPTLLSLCPESWSEQRRQEVAEFILATLRGFLIEWRTSGDAAGIDAGLAALTRALEREEQA
ncbi:TetR/AcrR family transcriptional regulator [Kribbella jiaozuonensis]|uniref:TetR/AcrR family transcriptional regulator n=1 Tax=Kribbella jiaozuonensis TaxID=2575441 RepID=A0A4U3LJJ0_9ACTN|nr:TetR/AcrR family transcriptional regulator [Kribbella jiaozuonensis]TKK75154.1 TetR/AcrR family transcriptional regulator [Kribbella jiaozuonensis]